MTTQIIIMCLGLLSDPVAVMSSKGGAGWEGLGYCGNCQKEGRSPQCERGAHTVLDQPWRAVKGEGIDRQICVTCCLVLNLLCSCQMIQWSPATAIPNCLRGQTGSNLMCLEPQTRSHISKGVIYHFLATLVALHFTPSVSESVSER